MLALVRVLNVIDSLNLGWNVQQLLSSAETADLFQLVAAVWAGKVIANFPGFYNSNHTVGRFSANRISFYA